MSFFSALKLRNIIGAIINPATEDTLALIKAKTDNLDVALSNLTIPSDQQHTIVDSSALPSGASTSDNQTNGTHKTQIVDSSGNIVIISDGGLVSMDYLTAISTGAIAGHEGFFALGYNSDVDNTREDIWEGGGVYTFPPAGGIQMRIVSSSANDSAAGTGIRTVELEYLDSSYNIQYEILTLNGTTVVDTVATNILRVQKLHTETAGSSGLAVGNITLSNVAQTITYAIISIDGNYARNAIWTVPAGKTAYVTGFQISAGAASLGHNSEFTIRATADHRGNLAPGIFQFKRIIQCTDGGIDVHLAIPIKIPATADIKLSVKSDGATANTIQTGCFEGWIE